MRVGPGIMTVFYEHEISHNNVKNKNRTTGPVAYLGPGLMLKPKFGSILTGGSGEEDFRRNLCDFPQIYQVHHFDTLPVR